MEKLSINILHNQKYSAIITVLDYEILLSEYLKHLRFGKSNYEDRHVIVDLALKNGIDKYRFIDFVLNSDGAIILDSNKYVTNDISLEKIANNFLIMNKDKIQNSVLTKSEIQNIIDSYK